MMPHKTPETICDHLAGSISDPVQALQMALIAGEQSGEAEPFDFDAFKARKRERSLA